MKKILVTFILLTCMSVPNFSPVFAQVDDYPTSSYVDGVFDWLYLSNSERQDRVVTIFKIMFPKGYVTNFPKKFLKSKLKNHLKDRNFKDHYEAVCSGVTHYRDVDMQKFVDFRYGSVPECPYYTKKYSIDGKLVRAMYLQNPETMYIYSETGSFIGVKNNNQVYTFKY